MKILSPLDRKEEVDELAREGAGEFYCGLLDETWHEKYPVISINRRPAGKGHFRRFEDLKDAVSRSRNHGIPVYFTLNEHYYVDEQYGLVLDYVRRSVDAGVAGIIIADYGLLAILKEMDLPVKIQVGTGGTVFNAQAARFYRKMGATGITLPRHLTLSEMRGIVKGIAGMEISVFVFNSRCINVDGFCTFEHGLSGSSCLPLYRNACMLPFDITLSPPGQRAERTREEIAGERHILERQHIWEKVHVDDHPCGACALYEFREMGIHGLKIVGRGNPLERKTADLRFLKTLLTRLEGEGLDQAAFRKGAAELYTRTYKRPSCIFMCYYPEVMEDPA